ncbi:MAG: 2-polyprenyl-3-methyl-6-methoxy-1,4-benzoquinone monooxygenase [Pseudohongiellaceae bacterium]
MNEQRKLNPVDQLLIQFDQALRTLVPGSSHAQRTTPAENLAEAELSESERRHTAGLMRINHTGEVCAQALYQGQALTARLPDVRSAMEKAAAEEVDHLAWCEQRLSELDSKTSLLNPVWYAMSFGVGAIAGLAGDKWSLGFVAETEQQVCDHLTDHLGQLPQQDHRSRAILEQMLVDEKNHGDIARGAGGAELPTPITSLMTGMAEIMKKTVYRF